MEFQELKEKIKEYIELNGVIKDWLNKEDLIKLKEYLLQLNNLGKEKYERVLIRRSYNCLLNEINRKIKYY